VNAAELFDASAGGYDAARRRLVPCFEDFYAAAVAALPFPEAAPLRILDLGAGTGLLSALLAVRFPRATFVLVDAAQGMLDRARERFAADPARFECVNMDYTSALPMGPFDAAVSALSIHHLPAGDKRVLFGRIFTALKAGGIFVNAEHVLGDTPAIERDWDARWEREARALGSDDAEIAGARERMTADRCSTLADQLHWLRESGFSEIACGFQRGRFAVFSGRR
jgi:tRNA (cmo5U34)-methyltransferase